MAGEVGEQDCSHGGRQAAENGNSGKVEVNYNKGHDPSDLHLLTKTQLLFLLLPQSPIMTSLGG